MRHGQAKSNVRAVCSCWPEKFNNPLTAKGKQTIKDSIKKFKAKGKTVDLIFASPLLRTQQTAEIVEKMFGIKHKTDKRLREIGFGEFNNKKLESMWKSFKTEKERINTRKDGEETYMEIIKRMMGFLRATDKKYKSKNIMVISHEGPLGLLQAKVTGLALEEFIKIPLERRIHKAEIRELN